MRTTRMTGLAGDWRTNQTKAFINLCCECGFDLSDSSSSLHRAYLSFSRAMFCQRMTAQTFTRSMRALGFHLVRGSTTRWLGIKHSPDRAFNAGSSKEDAIQHERLRAIAREKPSVRQVELFVRACCEINATADERSNDLFRSYRNWARAAGTIPMTGTAFGRSLRALGFGGRKSNVMVWLGLRLYRRQPSPPCADSQTGETTLPYGRNYGRPTG